MPDFEVTADTSQVRRGTNDLKEFNKELKAIRANSNDNVNATRSAQRAFDALNREYYEGRINLDQYNAALKRLRSESVKAGIAVNQFEIVTDRSTQKLKRFSSVGLQQVGYQVGDFAVQLQGGTNAAVAFGQQMSQLLGILGPYGAIAGAGVAIGTAFIAPLLDARKAAADFDDKLQEVEDQMEKVRDIMESSSRVDPFKSAQSSAEGFLALFERIDLQGKLQEQLVALMSDLPNMADLFVSNDRGISVPTSRTRAGWADLLRGMSGATTYEDRLAGAQAISDELIKIHGSYEDMNSTQQEFFRNLQQIIVSTQDYLELLNRGEEQYATRLSRIRVLMAEIDQERLERERNQRDEVEEGYLESFNMYVDALQSANEEYQKAQQYYEQTSKSLADQIILQERINQFGEDSVIVKELEKQMELEKFESMLRSKGLSEDMIRVLTQQYQTLLDIKYVANEITFSEVVRSAKELASWLGVSLATARSMVTVNTLGRGRNFGAVIPGEGAAAAVEEQRIAELQKAWADSLRTTSGGGGGGGGGISEAQRELDQYIKSIEDDYAESLKTLDTEMAKLNKVYEDGLIDTNEYRHAQEQLRESYREFDDFIESQLLSTFDAVRTGTETLGQALLDFANNVLFNIADKIFQERVGSGFADAASDIISGLFFAKGGVFNNGQVTPFASGGIVGSPTIFPMANGMGLMGEAGPEAIMPLKRNSQGALGVEASGGGTPVVVNIRSEVGGQPEVTQTGNGLDVLIKAVAADITQNGPVSRAISKKYTVNKRLSPR